MPHNTILMESDDSGRRVVINSVGGPSWPDNRWKRGLENVGGVVVWGSVKYWYMAKERYGPKLKNGNYNLRTAKFITKPYWRVKLDGYGLELDFAESEITFV